MRQQWPSDEGFESVNSFGSSCGPCEVRPYQVRCPEGHVMRGKISREILQPFRCSHPPVCDGCEKKLTRQDAYYRCQQCNFDYCMLCSRSQLRHPSELLSDGSRPMLELQPGDILLVGPARYDIHHVILVRGYPQPAPSEIINVLKRPPGIELILCPTIESTQGLRGKTSWWHPTTLVLERNADAGTAAILAYMPPEAGKLQIYAEPQPLKILLNPLRQERSGEQLDNKLFQELLQQCSARSQRYSWTTAIAAFLAYQRTMDFSHTAAQEPLLDKIVKSWKAPPICSAVAVKVWQQYLMASRSSGEAAALAIHRWIPVWCNTTTPSALVKSLTHREWGLYGSLEA